MNLEWNVFYENWNGKTIELFNIFKHHSFNEDMINIIEDSETKEELSERTKRAARYYFSCKSEYEIVLTSWPPHIDGDKELARLQKEKEDTIAKGWTPKYLDVRPVVAEKIDIYDQLMLNWDRFIDYLWLSKLKRIFDFS